MIVNADHLTNITDILPQKKNLVKTPELNSTALVKEIDRNTNKTSSTSLIKLLNISLKYKLKRTQIYFAT